MVRELLGKLAFAFKNPEDAGLRYEFLAASVVLPKEATSLIKPAMNCGWLKRLEKLAPNSKLTLSLTLNRLRTARSTLLIGGSRKVFRPAVARAPCWAVMYCAVPLVAR